MASHITVVDVQFGGNQGMWEGGVYFVVSSPLDRGTKNVYDVNKHMVRYFV